MPTELKSYFEATRPKYERKRYVVVLPDPGYTLPERGTKPTAGIYDTELDVVAWFKMTTYGELADMLADEERYERFHKSAPTYYWREV